MLTNNLFLCQIFQPLAVHPNKIDKPSLPATVTFVACFAKICSVRCLLNYIHSSAGQSPPPNLLLCWLIPDQQWPYWFSLVKWPHMHIWAAFPPQQYRTRQTTQYKIRGAHICSIRDHQVGRGSVKGHYHSACNIKLPPVTLLWEYFYKIFPTLPTIPARE